VPRGGRCPQRSSLATSSPGSRGAEIRSPHHKDEEKVAYPDVKAVDVTRRVTKTRSRCGIILV
jgi:hypothetical protein